MLTAVALIATVTAIFTGYLTLSVGDQYGHPGSAGWNLLNQGKSGNDASITVHHVIASDYGVHVVYSITMDAPNGRLSSDIVTKPIIDGTKVTDSTTDYVDVGGGISVKAGVTGAVGSWEEGRVGSGP